MDTSSHTIETLFQQIGLPSDQASIEHFIADHKPLSSNTTLSQASFWNSAQSSFIEEAIADDSDWAEVVDQLDAMLRH